MEVENAMIQSCNIDITLNATYIDYLYYDLDLSLISTGGSIILKFNKSFLNSILSIECIVNNCKIEFKVQDKSVIPEIYEDTIDKIMSIHTIDSKYTQSFYIGNFEQDINIFLQMKFISKKYVYEEYLKYPLPDIVRYIILCAYSHRYMNSQSLSFCTHATANIEFQMIKDNVEFTDLDQIKCINDGHIMQFNELHNDYKGITDILVPFTLMDLYMYASVYTRIGLPIKYSSIIEVNIPYCDISKNEQENIYIFCIDLSKFSSLDLVVDILNRYLHKLLYSRVCLICYSSELFILTHKYQFIECSHFSKDHTIIIDEKCIKNIIEAINSFDTKLYYNCSVDFKKISEFICTVKTVYEIEKYMEYDNVYSTTSSISKNISVVIFTNLSATILNYVNASEEMTINAICIKDTKELDINEFDIGLWSNNMCIYRDRSDIHTVFDFIDTISTQKTVKIQIYNESSLINTLFTCNSNGIFSINKDMSIKVFGFVDSINITHVVVNDIKIPISSSLQSSTLTAHDIAFRQLFLYTTYIDIYIHKEISILSNILSSYTAFIASSNKTRIETTENRSLIPISGHIHYIENNNDIIDYDVLHKRRRFFHNRHSMHEMHRIREMREMRQRLLSNF
jgi:hypothetical protein